MFQLHACILWTDTAFDIDSPDLRSKYPAGLNSEPQLPDLMNEVAAKIPAKWLPVGIAVNLAHNDLECLPASDPCQCFTSIFATWKRKETKPYTWSTLIHALRTPAVGELNLANIITSKLN